MTTRTPDRLSEDLLATDPPPNGQYPVALQLSGEAGIAQPGATSLGSIAPARELVGRTRVVKQQAPRPQHPAR